MNGSTTTTPLARAITSLTTTANNKKGGGKATTTSISEALALSVADRICDNNKRKLIGGQSTITSAAATPNSPTPDNNNDTTTTTTAMNGTTRIKNRQIRVVSAEHPTKNNNSATKSSPMKSSMSSAVADLASGMPNFNNSGGNNNSSGGNNAPIISGTAAAVLALQSPFHSSSHHVDSTHPSTLGGGGVAIVSNSSSLETTAGGGLTEGESSAGNSNTTAVPNPLSILSEGAAATISSPTEDRTSLSLHSNSSNLSPQSVKSYADGAPIIAGTAAHAQMAAIATATAARITSIHLEGNGGEEESSSSGLSPSGIHAVANLGNAPDRYIISGEQRTGDGGAGGGSNNTTTTRPHGFEVGQPPPTFGGRNGSCSVVKSTISMKSGGKNALFSVDHGRKQARVTPEDGHQPQCNASSSSRTIPPQSSNNNDDDMPIITQTKAGGMDILAELTCHALPLALPQGSSTYTSSTSYNHPSYPQHHHNSSSSYNESSIPSYQEIYQEQGHTSQHHPQHQNRVDHVYRPSHPIKRYIKKWV